MHAASIDSAKWQNVVKRILMFGWDTINRSDHNMVVPIIELPFEDGAYHPCVAILRVQHHWAVQIYMDNG